MTHHTHHDAPARVQMFATRHGLDEDTRRSLVTMLNHRLADSLDLYTQTKHAHWNVKGMNFYQLHLLFDELAETVEKHVDMLAERATALGGTALGTVRMAAQASSLPEMPVVLDSDVAWVEAMVDRYARHAKKMGESIDRAEEMGDKGTADMLTEMVQDLDKALYFLESHVQAPARR
ncbi:MAG TPA: DNA starvation/stationary phase protection protein Dps [Candidatus Thermoplasmatota archaeon]|nr:DNA starvation/stationary phase protection protein Dps [Candidatus Thermoplasmatota archaeon]